MDEVNAELVKFVSPQKLETPGKKNVVVRLRNTGMQSLTTAKIKWAYNGSDTMTYDWSGDIASSETDDVVLADSLEFPYGLSSLIAWVEVQGDTYHDNDTLIQNTYIFHEYKFTYDADFDDRGLLHDDFYAYETSGNSTRQHCAERCGIRSDGTDAYHLSDRQMHVEQDV